MKGSAWTLAAVSLMAGLIGGCGGDDSPGAGPEPERAIEEAAQERAESMVLQIDDLPSDWRGSEREGDDPSEEFLECAGIDLGHVTYIADADSENFTLEDAQLNSDAKIFNSPSEAQSALTGFKEGLLGPRGARCYRNELQETLDDEGDIDYAVGDVAVGELNVTAPSAAEDFVAYRLKIPIKSQGERGTLFADEVIIRHGDAVVDIATIDLGAPLNTRLRDRLAQLTATRASQLD